MYSAGRSIQTIHNRFGHKHSHPHAYRTSGIGRALALSCLKRGANVTIVGRRQPDEQLAKATFTQADLTTMRSARKLADTLPLQKYDIAVFTNGIMPTAERKASEEGVELDMAVSMLSRLAIVSQFKAKNFGADRVDKSVKPRCVSILYSCMGWCSV